MEADIICQKDVKRLPKTTVCKGRFTRYNFVAYNKLTTGLRHDLGPTDNRKPVVGLIYKKQFMSSACRKLVVCDKIGLNTNENFPNWQR